MDQIAILTSGGDAPGMNAAVRAALRVGLERGLEVYGVEEGFEGLIHGGEMIRPLAWADGGGIIQSGGTILGTARSAAFRTIEGRRKGARNLIERGIDGLIVIGGDGSLSGAQVLYEEWDSHVAALADEGFEAAKRWGKRRFLVAGIPGSIDNDLYGTDMAIGADTALNTAVRAVDQLVSTANAHQRTFVIEVMGRNCGYLALMTAIATAGDWVLIPEQELQPRWHQELIDALQSGRSLGKRHGMVLCAEGARHTDGLPISTADLQRLLASRLGVDVRVTVLGHVQRGGAPSAFDRNLATRLGAAAVEYLAAARDHSPPAMVGLSVNRTIATPLSEVVAKSRSVTEQLDAGNHAAALEGRNRAFRESLALLATLNRPMAAEYQEGMPAIAILSGDAESPGMNATIRTAVRAALTEGYRVIGVENGFLGLVEGQFRPLDWMDVSGWARQGGTALGTSRHELGPDDTNRIAAHMREQGIGALVCLGGWSTYQQAAVAAATLQIPVVCVPATIDNNLPGTHFTIGADTALNSIVEAIDKIKDAAVTHHRTFVIEVMGRYCGYLAALAGMAGGAEKVYLPEEGISLAGLLGDVREINDGFANGKKLAIVIANEHASPNYDTDFLRRVFEQEGGELSEARSIVLGHLQRGGAPRAFDRILGARLGTAAMTAAVAQLRAGQAEAQVVGVRSRGVVMTSLAEALQDMDRVNNRPREQWWWMLRGLQRILAQPEAGWHDGVGREGLDIEEVGG
jgi:6-phosphofructokinase 1